MLNLQEMGKRIRESREKLGLSRQELAERLEISTYYIGQLERGERMMSLDVLEKMASCLHVSIDYLVWGRQKSEDTEENAMQIREESKLYACTQDEELHELLKLCSMREKELITKLIKVILPYMMK